MGRALTQAEKILPREYLIKLNKFRGRPFWIENPEEHEREYDRTAGECCFNHLIGLPEKYGKKKPLFDYQINLFKRMFFERKPFNKHRRQWIKKSRGMGISEYYLRLVAWLCLFDDSHRGEQIMIICGPRLDIAKDLIMRLKDLFFWRLGIIFPYNDTVIFLNGCRVVAYPSHTTASYRGQPRVFFIIVDEADFFPKSLQRHVRDVIQGYYPKTNPYVALFSTPNEPFGLFYNIESEKEEVCQYDRIFLRWEQGLGKIFTQNDIDVARLDPLTFRREFDLEYMFGVGKVFTTQVIEMLKKYGRLFRPKGGDYEPANISKYTQKIMSIDPSFGTSGTGIVITEYLPDFNNVRVIYASKFLDEDYDSLTSLVASLIEKYWVSHIFIDGAHPGLIRSVKSIIGEAQDDATVDRLKKRAHDMKRPLSDFMRVVPVLTSNRTRQNLSHCKSLTEAEGFVAIDPDFFGDLIEELEVATQHDGRLDKGSDAENDRTMDLMDAYQYNLLYYSTRSMK
jgi:hypothetical protein